MASMAAQPAAAPPPARDVLRHGAVLRLTHWINALAIIVLLMTGANIFNAHPQLYWGDSGNVDDRRSQWLAIGASGPPGAARGHIEIMGTRFDTTGVLGTSKMPNGQTERVAYPRWASFPGPRNLAIARNWHFFFAWVIIINGLVYLAHGLASGRIRRELIPRLAELKPAHLWHDIVQHLKLNFPKGEAALRYEVLQKLAYAGVALVAIPLVILTGMTMSPGLNAAFPFLVELFGGRQSARSIHWIAANLILVFLVVHLVMVVLSGPITQLRAMITGRLRIEGKAA
jgi:thiosulfate reductase cytochrome b subunit